MLNVLMETRTTRVRAAGIARWLGGLCLLFALRAGAAEPEATAIGFLGDSASAAARGAELGIAEANVQGRYFGRVFTLVPVAPTPPTRGVAIAALDEATLRAAQGEGRLVINAGDPADALRDDCPGGLLHTLPSARMIADASRQAARAGVGAAGPGALRVEAWHPSLERFAARDLNNRYRARFGEGMDSQAWAGWAAARAIGEAVIRGGSAEPAAIGRYLRDDFSFDGQKGVALSFRPNGQLRQPLYLVAGDEVVAEAPVLDLVPDRDLDTLGRVECDPAS